MVIVMDVLDRYRLLIGAYYGIRSLDAYPRRLYILSDLEKYIRGFVEANRKEDIAFEEEADKVLREVPLKTKLQDSLIVLNELDGPIDLVLMIKLMVKEMRYQK